MSIQHTRVLLHAALEGDLSKVDYIADPLFGFHIPVVCKNVPQEVLNVRNTWKDKNDYAKKAKELAERFVKNFKKYEEHVTDGVRKAGPNIEV